MRAWLKKRRIDRGLTMKDMSEKLCISESYYCSIENGERQKRMDMLIAAGISSALDMPISEIAELEHLRS